MNRSGGSQAEFRDALRMFLSAGTLATILLIAPAAGAPQVSQTPSQINQGAATFRLFCSPCHGIHAKGGRGPDLTRGPYRNGDSDAAIFRVISRGVTGSEMPSFSADLSPGEIWQIISYLRSIRKPAAAPITGNREEGENLFWGEGGCGQCHMVGGRGGRLGPDLTRAGRGLSLAYLRQSILDPSAEIVPGYETATVVTRDGRTIRGIAKRFDDFNLELMEPSGKLVFFRRSDLVSAKRVSQSMMPPAYGQMFTPAQLNDLLAYLASLRSQPATAPPPPPIDLKGLDNSDLLNAQNDPSSWLMYGRNYAGWRYSPLSKINTGNVAGLRPQWIFHAQGALAAGRFETTALVRNGVMWLTGTSNHAYAIDLRTGLDLWQYHDPAPASGLQLCCGQENRGFAMLGNRLFKVNIQGDLLALDASTGRMIWKVHLADYRHNYTATGAPLVIKNMVLTGIAGSDFGIRGFIDAYDVNTGKRLWRFYTVPETGEPGSNTWPPNTWQHGGGATWVTGTYDPELNLIYWGTGNPGPDLDGSVRAGDNLYTCSLVALDPDTGKLKWHFQFTPHDTHDWDAVADPVLVDLLWHGRRVKAVIQANRNGFFYALDRTNGKFLFAKRYTQVSWAKGIAPDGRPILIPNQEPTDAGNRICPGLGGGHNWSPTAYSPQTGLYYFASTDGCAIYYKLHVAYADGRRFQASTTDAVPREPATDSIIAIDPATGEIKWRKEVTGQSGGLLATGGGLIFSGDPEGYVFAIDARTGKTLWHFQTGGAIKGPPITYQLDGKQYLAVPSGSDMIAFALP